MRFDPGEIVRISNRSDGGAVSIQHGVDASSWQPIGIGAGTHCLVLDDDDTGVWVASRRATKVLVDDIICWFDNRYLVRV
jgi:alpha-D-ribose 1-methylphosphonate 5-triphosphate synthase subunit PhnH